MRTIILCLAFICNVMLLQAQSVSPDVLNNQWDANWITVPGARENDYGVYLFRKTVDLHIVPDTYIIHVSADNRYKLYVNEKLVSAGPARGDFFYWNYETVDIAPYLVEGINIIAAKIWNDGNLRPEAQISWKTGFILQSDSPLESQINTNNSWKCIRDTSYFPFAKQDMPGYYVAGTGEFIDMRKNMRGWNKMEYSDESWQKAVNAYWRSGSPKGLPDAFGWMLVPSTLPQMELTTQRLQITRESTGVTVPQSFPATPGSFTIPENTKASILLDQGFLTNAYPHFVFSNGRNASISIKYAEALFIPANSVLYGNPAGGYMGSPALAGKGNRNEIKGKVFLGRNDSIVSDGTLHQEFTTLYWRTFRYILISIQTQDDPLIIDDFYGTFTGYPFELKSSFNAGDVDLQKILDIGWRTARSCAMETYMDCPYYEQLQYIGDTRIQALISIYNTGDDRLVRNALNLMDHSRIAEGLTSSRHPSYSPQFIPPFSLWYIGMLYDYYMYRPDSSFVKEKLSGTRQILDFFHRYQQADGSLKNVPYWNFTDWVNDNPAWKGGAAPQGSDGTSCIYDLQLLWTYQLASVMEKQLGMPAMADLYNDRIRQLAETVKTKYWDASRDMFADTPEKNQFSQHANALAILTGMVEKENVAALARKILTDKTLTPASIYFKYYLHQALIKAGMGNDYISWLDKWRENIAMGMTTWAESSDISTARSDCHAWGSSPNIEFYRTVLGIDTDSPGFRNVKIEPHPGNLKKISGSVPHYLGNINVSYSLEKGKWNIEITLPQGLTGSFIWKNNHYDLKQGLNNFQL